jgi:hypothetical protein
VRDAHVENIEQIPSLARRDFYNSPWMQTQGEDDIHTVYRSKMRKKVPVGFVDGGKQKRANSNLLRSFEQFVRLVTAVGPRTVYVRMCIEKVQHDCNVARLTLRTVGCKNPASPSAPGKHMANSKIERVLRHDGIVAVLDWYLESGDQPEWVGDERWNPIVVEAVKLRQIAAESSVRVLVGDHAVLVSGDEKHVVGVVFIKGHPVVKSVVRMVRQLLRPRQSQASASV